MENRPEEKEITVAEEKTAAAHAGKEVVIEVKDLWLTYTLMKRGTFGDFLIPKSKRKNPPKIFEAIRGVSFTVTKGQIVGIVGQNGAGKSTLLRAVTGIFAPDKGSVNTFDNTVSLLSIGVGFNRNLTGRENIYLSAMLMGFNKQQVEEKYGSIVEFSELGDFIEQPVQTYSSGMFSKLAFSISVIMETDIILVDEVLSVGDARFRKKSFEKMQELIQDSDKTVMIVSHSPETISEMCSYIIWLHHGEIVMQGPADEVLPKYDEFMDT